MKVIENFQFPETPEEARSWAPIIRRVAVHSRVLCVARTRIEGKWAAYIAPVAGINHDNETNEVLENGNKLASNVAQALFPIFGDLPYAR